MFHRSFLCLLLLAGGMAGTEREIRTSPFDRLIPQVAVGGGWQTTMSVLNMDVGEVAFRLVFRTSDGRPWAVPLEGRGTASSFALTLTTGARDSLDQGWARIEVDCCYALAGFAVFRQRVTGRPDFEAVVPFSRPSNASFLLYDNTAGFTTGLSLANGYASAAAPLTMWVRDENGNVLATKSLNLPADGRLVTTLPALAPESGSRKGFIEISSPGAFGVLGLRFADGGSFTSFHSFEPRQ
jgi:hypothetical protein